MHEEDEKNRPNEFWYRRVVDDLVDVDRSAGSTLRTRRSANPSGQVPGSEGRFGEQQPPMPTDESSGLAGRYHALEDRAQDSYRLRSVTIRDASAAMDAIEFYSAPDDGPRPLFLRSHQAKYTVDRYLEDLDTRYGGIDAVLIWATYPNLGIDDRNQLDMVRSMPGGTEGLRQLVADFHRRGVRVLFPMMMWDEGTRDPGKNWPDALAELMKEINADGINGDTQDGVPLAFSLAAEKVNHPLAFEPEHGPHDEGLAWNVLTWGDYKFQRVPTVDRYRWLEPRHQVHVQGRWNRDKTDDLQFAFFNGEGWESWENVWGIWNGVTSRDGEATRRVATIERATAPFLASREWEPFYPMERVGVYASRWPLGRRAVWTIVNRNEYDVSGLQMSYHTSQVCGTSTFITERN